jgi:hypothetical protein
MKGTVCGAFQADSLLGSAVTDASGSCDIPLHNVPAEGVLVVKVSGFNVLLQQDSLSVADYWRGITSNWHDPQNWFTGQVPDQNTDVIIPANPSGSNFPVLSTGSAMHCRNICVEEGATLHIDENDDLIIHGN